MIKLLDSHLYDSGASDPLRHLIMYIARAAKYIDHAIETEDTSMAGTSNASGEDQLALDVLSDKVIEENLRVCRLVAAVASEEKEGVMKCECDEKEWRGKFSVAYDPLDGSSLLDANFAIGSIFSIFKGEGFVGKTGRDQVAALYIIYGPQTMLVYSIGKGVHCFTLNDVGEFTLEKENLTIGETAKHFAPGNLRSASSNPKYKELVNHWMDEGYTLRYSGGMVPDIHHMLSKGGGIFTYPAHAPKYPKGKLRLLFECNPFAYLIENAGGAASDGEQSILDIKIEEIHQRTPIFVGSKGEVEKVVEGMR